MNAPATSSLHAPGGPESTIVDASSERAPRKYLISPAYDFGWFVLPGLVALGAAAVLGTRYPSTDQEPLYMWIVGILLVDVTHVYASLYRTYFDPGQRARHFKRLVWAPVLCFGVGFLLHLNAPEAFWSVLAYLAVWHFIKQHEGYAVLYVRAGRESRFDRRLTALAVWAGTLGPVLWWHAHLPTNFGWLKQGDFFPGLPREVGVAALWLEIPIWLAFFGRRIQLAARGQTNPMVFWLVVVPAANWHLGIVWFNDARIFLITNVFLHGLPYMALVWKTGGKETVAKGLDALGWRRMAARTLLLVLAFYGFLLALGYVEELLWDQLYRHEYPEIFGRRWVLGDFSPLVTSLAAALLTMPQATHYLLDRWIWRVGPDNPELAAQLNLAPKTPDLELDAA